MFFNPTDIRIIDSIELPLYYTGLSKTAKITRENGKSEVVTLNRDYSITVNLGNFIHCACSKFVFAKFGHNIFIFRYGS